MDCCKCFSFLAILLVVGFFLTGLIPLPEQWGALAAEKSGEDSEHMVVSPNTKIPTTTISSGTDPWNYLGEFDQSSKRWDELRSIILANRLTTSMDLQEPNTAAYKALQWLTKESGASVSEQVVNSDSSVDVVEAALLERYTLAVFYYATQEIPNNQTITMQRHPDLEDAKQKSLVAALHSSPHLMAKDPSLEDAFRNSGLDNSYKQWHESKGWMGMEKVCDWFGIQCHEDGRVQSISLSQNGLQGEIPSELRALSKLQVLDLSYNHLRQQIPDVLLTSDGSWDQLESLDLSNNRLTGTLSPKVGGLSALQSLNLAKNGLTGSLPSSIGDLTSLTSLSLQDNQLSGAIPDFSLVSNLRILQLGNNHFNGGFPFQLTHNKNLVELRLNQNSLEGTLPPELDSLLALEALDVSCNKLQGPVPDVFHRLHKLQVLDMHNNALGQYHDTLKAVAEKPVSLGALTNLKQLKLNSNRFHGDIPEEWWNMTNLEVFYLHDNDFTGSIPDTINLFSALRDFQLQDSFMSGTIPTQLAECQNLEKLTVYNSRFTGVIPEELCPSIKFLAADCSSEIQCSCCDRCY